jgi:hypothetical protein
MPYRQLAAYRKIRQLALKLKPNVIPSLVMRKEPSLHAFSKILLGNC